MTVLQSQRNDYRAKWRMLAQGMVACAARPEMDPSGLGALTAEQPVKYWVTPTDDRADSGLCAAAAMLARAYAQTPTIKRRLGLAEALMAVGSALGDLLDASEPEQRETPARRFRGDIDG